ncbi:acetyltransferase [Occallatibacter savannae]|uniref:acetyltransferase n=1 Tax=Occallatibacter savannae TaxID=1002691 RepID=UPI000D697344|nr:acetyltransferase [Occallatibacter savannae]
MLALEKPVILLGAGGHARVLLSTLLQRGARVVGFADPGAAPAELLGVPRLGGDESVVAHDSGEVLLVNGVGSVGDVTNRLRVYEYFRTRGYAFASVIHPSAIIAPEGELKDGAQIMAGAILQTGCVVEENCIINTGARVDHDCIIRQHAHLAPGVVLSGAVEVGRRAHIGTGAVVIQGVRIGEDAVVGAGAVVLEDVPSAATVVGVPARPLTIKA